MLKIVGASFGRTGTRSVCAALEMLGLGPCHFMKALSADPAHARSWLRAADGETPDWDRLLAGYSATVAWPGAYFWRQLSRAYPSAKVLLIVREPQSWYDSVARTLYRTRPTGLSDGAAGDAHHHAIERIVWQGTFSGRFTDRDHAIGVYLSHLDEVRRSLPRDRLVEYVQGSGWQPLCAAFGLDIPDTPFPHENTTATYLKRARSAGALPAA